MAAVKMAYNIFETFENSSWAHVLFCTKTSVSGIIWFRCIILMQNQVINSWFVKVIIIMTDFKMDAGK